MIFNHESAKPLKKCARESWRNVAFMSHRYLIDILLMHGIIQAVKFSARSHRPHFFETCKPDTMINCTLGTFVSEFKCTNTDANVYQIIDASMSFFSGHASTCVYSCFFMIWYIQKRMSGNSIFLIPFLQASLICLSFYGSISRVFDHRHHWWDVLTGAILGLLTAYHTVRMIFNFFNMFNNNFSALSSVTCCARTTTPNQNPNPCRSISAIRFSTQQITKHLKNKKN